MSWFAWDNLAEIVIAYAVIAVLVFVFIRWLAKDEPTAHGQSVALFFGFWIGALWPIAVPAVLIIVIVGLIILAWQRISGKRK